MPSTEGEHVCVADIIHSVLFFIGCKWISLSYDANL